MPVKADAPITITAFDWVPDFAKGQVRDLRVRWALEEVGQDYSVRCLPQGEQKEAAHRAPATVRAGANLRRGRPDVV